MAELPSWQPLEGGSVPISDGAGRGRVVALVAARGAVRGGWAAEAALDLARAWSASGRKIVLADAALDHPALHAAAGIENAEGLSDASLYGASVRRVARPVEDGAFFVVTAGSPVADAASVAGTARWRRLCDGFEEAGVTLLLFLRDGDRGAEAFLAAASDLIVLAERGEPPPGIVVERAAMVRAVTGPAGPRRGAASAPPGAAARAPGTSAPAREGPGGPTPAQPSGGSPPARPQRVAPTRAAARAQQSSGSRPHVLLVLLVVLLALVVLAVLGIIQVPFLSPDPAGSSSAAVTLPRHA